MASENKLQDIIQTSLESLRTLVDSNTIIGNPIPTESGTTIIPVSKISMGFASGGLDYSGKALPQKQNFGGGGGTGLSIQPVGFLVVKANGDVAMIPVDAAAPGAIEQVADLIERGPEIFSKVKSFFAKKKPTDPSPDPTGETVEITIDADPADADSQASI